MYLELLRFLRFHSAVTAEGARDTECARKQDLFKPFDFRQPD